MFRILFGVFRNSLSVVVFLITVIPILLLLLH